MYDFLDKIGLKTALEQIKAKFPSSLPANGGNADTVDGLHADDFIKSTHPTINGDLIFRSSSSVNSKGAIYSASDMLVIRNISNDGSNLCDVEITNDRGVFINGKEISTTPIKKMTFPSVATNAGGGGTLFSADFGTPITIACTSRGNTQCTPFYYGDGNQWLILAKDATTLDPIPAGTYSFDVWYI